MNAGSNTVWAAAASAPWIILNSGATGTGNRTVFYAVAANQTHESRTSLIYLEHIPYLVQQLGIPINGEGIQLGLFRMDRQSPPSALSGNPPGFAEIVDSFGLPGDQPVMGDWTGDGHVRIGVFRDGKWYLDLNGNRRWDGIEGGDGQYALGLAGDTAVVGDWTGDGVTKLGVFRNGTWYLDLHNRRQYDPSLPMFAYGLPGDIPVVGKWKPGSGIDQIGVFRKGRWYVDSNGDRAFEVTDDCYDFGSGGDIPVVSWSRSRLGVYHNGTWVLDINGSRRLETADALIVFGSRGDRPLIGEW